MVYVVANDVLDYACFPDLGREHPDYPLDPRITEGVHDAPHVLSSGGLVLSRLGAGFAAESPFLVRPLADR